MAIYKKTISNRTGLRMLFRYYFNITDGDQVIRDEEGILLADINTAVLYAMTAIEELRHEIPHASDDWNGWTMEIINGSGEVVSVIPLAELTLKDRFLQ